MSIGDKDDNFEPIKFDVDERISRAPAAAPAPVKSNNGLVGLLLVISLVASAGCIYLYLELQKAMVSINEQGAKITSIENTLSATGEEMGNSTVALQVKVGELGEKTTELWDQMDKLWASAWRKNQKEIGELRSSVKNFQTDVNTVVKEVNTRVGTTESDTKQLATRLNAVNANIKENVDSMLSFRLRQEQLEQSDSGKSAELRTLNEKIILLERRNTNLLKQIEDLETTLNALVEKSV